MNKSKKITVIIFVIIAILIVVFGYLYLSGIYPTIHGYKTKIYFKEVSGLKIGSPVYIRGMEKGKVNKIVITDDCQSVQVLVTLDKSIKLTEDTKFAIRSLSYFGTDRILTVTPGTGAEVSGVATFYGDNEVIELEKFFISLDNVITKLESIPITTELTELKTELYSKFDTLAKGFSMPLVDMTKQLEALVIKLDTLGEFLKQEGTVKKLMTSEELYQEVRDTNQKLKELLEDIKTNPKKYFTIKVF
jgi:ABC-type transporter Mla subunit MlaD